MEAYHEKMIDTISTIRKVDRQMAVQLLRQCVATVSAKLGVTISEINNIIFQADFLHHCLAGICSHKDLEACRKSCNCVIYTDNTCIPRNFSNASLINKDPDKYAKDLKTQDLEDFIKKANFLHFNYEGGGLTDNTFDSLLFNLNKRLRTKGRKLRLIGAQPVEKIRAELPIPMPSLNKVYPGTKELIKFLDNNPGETLVYSEKLDGISGMIVYRNKKIANIYTRGNGEIGGDVTYLKDYISLPQKLTNYTNLVVRGEFVVKKTIFKQKYSELYATPRNFVSGQIARGNITSYVPDIEFIAYEVVQIEGSEDTPTPLQKYNILSEENFSVVDYGIFRNQTVFDILYEYKIHRETSAFEIDGLVLRYNATAKVLEALENPIDSVAFKALLDEQLRETKVINVDWRISRYGRYVPVAVYEAVYVNGIRLTRASAHNAAHVRDWNMGRGTEIVVARAGDVIPQIKDVQVNKDIIPIFPSDKYEWHWKRMNIELDDIENNREVQIKRITHFFSTIGTRGIGPKTIENLWEKGYNDIKKVTGLKVNTLKNLKGFGPKKSQKIVDTIADAMSTVPLDRYIAALTITDFKVSRSLLKQLIRVFPSILEDKYDSDDIKRELYVLKKDKKLRGFGVKRIDAVSNEIPKIRKFLLSLNSANVLRAIENQKLRRAELLRVGYNKKIQDKSFVLSGWMNKVNYELEDMIYDNLGTISSTVTSATSAVIVPSVMNITSKMMQAHELDVPVLSVNEFMEKFS